VISFNWDLLHETALWKAKKWHYSDGYGFTCRDGSQAPPCSPVQLLKLHGSVNWMQHDNNDAEPKVLYKEHLFRGASDGSDVCPYEAGRWDQACKLIIPTYLKTITANALLAGLWVKAGDALRGADEIVVIGYRLHKADEAAHQLFASSLLGNASRPHVEVVSPGPARDDNWDGLCETAGYPRPGRTQKPFEAWAIEVPGEA
jgi:hypothetical protein